MTLTGTRSWGSWPALPLLLTWTGLATVSCGATTEGASSAAATTEVAASAGTSSETQPAVDCKTPVIPAAITGGCNVRLVTPKACETIDLSGDKPYEFAWTTDGTGCETPWTVCVAGNPVTDPNSTCVQLSVNVSRGISRTGGVLPVKASEIAGLTSDNGLYHWIVRGFYGSHPASVAFRVKK